MSNKIKQKQSQWGGSRKGAGRPDGSGTKTKICVSVTGEIWEDALSRWKKPGSHLVDRLLMRFVANEVKP